jgi:hypothetical protein
VTPRSPPANDVAGGLDVLVERGLTFDVVAVFPGYLRLVAIVGILVARSDPTPLTLVLSWGVGRM